MTAVERRLLLLEDERAIERTMRAYGHALDYGLEADWLACWTEDAVLFWPDKPPIAGTAALLAAFRGHTHAPDLYHKHFMVEPRITVTGDEARVESMFCRLDMYEAGPQIRSFGRYRDVLVRCADGAWRFRERRVEREARRPASP